MTQYCRYCTACHVANGNWCEIKEKELTDAQIKHSNKCRDFEFCSMDVYDENRTYQPRQKKQKPKPAPSISQKKAKGWRSRKHTFSMSAIPCCKGSFRNTFPGWQPDSSEKDPNATVLMI